MAADSAPTRVGPTAPASPNQLWFLNLRSALPRALTLSGSVAAVGFVTKDVASELIGTITREEEKASEPASD
jgi:hypothetical protein